MCKLCKSEVLIPSMCLTRMNAPSTHRRMSPATVDHEKPEATAMSTKQEIEYMNCWLSNEYAVGKNESPLHTTEKSHRKILTLYSTSSSNTSTTDG